MHGRLKVRTTEENAAIKAKERLEKVRKYVKLREKILTKRSAFIRDEEAFALTEAMLSINPDFATIWNFRREIIAEKMTPLAEGDQGKVVTLNSHHIPLP